MENKTNEKKANKRQMSKEEKEKVKKKIIQIEQRTISIFWHSSLHCIAITVNLNDF